MSKIFLRAFEPNDYILINKWSNDFDIQKLLGGNTFFVSLEREKEWVLKKSLNDTYEIYMAVCLRENNKMIGYISLNNIDYKNRKAYWGGMIIGDKEERNKGYATSAAFLMLQYGFEELNLNKITGKWLEDNKASIIIGCMMGFKKEGKLIEEVYKNNKYNNVIIMSLFKNDYERVKQNF